MIGFDFSKLPGDLGDTRFNLYILEHFYQFILGNVDSFWSAPFYYPYQNTIAFSDSHLGSAPIYSLLRILGLKQTLSLQFWIIIGYLLNYVFSSYVLKKLGLNSISAALGGFLFSFGLPVLSQQNHIQLTYRFLVPIASYLFWRFAIKPTFSTFVVLLTSITLQFYFSIYIGFFLILLLLVMSLLFPAFLSPPSEIKFLSFWKNRCLFAWKNSSIKEKYLFFFGVSLFVFLMGFLLIPYYITSKMYGFSRSPEEIVLMLPMPQSYLLADHSKLWNWIQFLLPSIQLRHEHQLFIGLSATILFVLSPFIINIHPNQKFALMNIYCVFILVGLTLRIEDFSIYQYFSFLPVFNSIRSVSRIILVLIWPISIVISFVVDSYIIKTKKIIHILSIIFLSLLLVLESLLYNHYTFSTKESQERLTNYYQYINETNQNINDNSIIFIGPEWGELWYLSELDGMLLSQELGISTLNGYSGNFPYEYQPSLFCDQISYRVQNYINFKKIEDPSFFHETVNRVIPINMDQCEFFWLK